MQEAVQGNLFSVQEAHFSWILLTLLISSPEFTMAKKLVWHACGWAMVEVQMQTYAHNFIAWQCQTSRQPLARKQIKIPPASFHKHCNIHLSTIKYSEGNFWERVKLGKKCLFNITTNKWLHCHSVACSWILYINPQEKIHLLITFGSSLLDTSSLYDIGTAPPMIVISHTSLATVQSY